MRPARLRREKLRRPKIGECSLDGAAIERAARYASRCEGLNPEATTCAGRKQWEVYAQLLRTVYLPAIEHALAGMRQEGNDDEQGVPDNLDPGGPGPGGLRGGDPGVGG